LPTDHADIIQCSCGQRMRIPAESKSNVFKCVRCGSFVERTAQDPSSEITGTRRKKNEGILIAEDQNTLLDVFLQAGLISEEQVRQASTEYVAGKEKVFETLLRLKLITLEHFHAFMTKESGVAAINLANFSIDRNLIDLIPQELAVQHWVLPIDKLGRSLTVAMVCPMDAEAIAAVEHYSGLRLRPMLCTIDDFQHSLSKHYRSGTTKEDKKTGSPSPPVSKGTQQPEVTKGSSEKKDIQEQLFSIENLPIQSRIMNQVDATVGGGAESLRQLVAVAQKSPPFAARILSIANSQAFGISGNVESVPMAVALLGDESISIIAASMPKYPAAAERLWIPSNRFARNVAEIAYVLASICGRMVPGIAHTAALLHNLGSYALSEASGDAYRRIDPSTNGLERQHAEEAVFGIGHTEAGSILCRRWNLPNIFVSAIRHYLTPEKAESYRDIAELLFIAAQLATVEGEIKTEGMKRCNDSLKYLNISPTDVSRSIQEHIKGSVSA
jgi:HD-like signal output (HDOD) protein